MWYWVLAVIATIWLIIDGLSRGAKSSWLWPSGALLLWPIVLPFYFATRPLKAGEMREGGTAWNVLKNFVLMWTVLIAVGVLAGMWESGKQLQKPMTEAEKVGAGLGIMAAIGLWGALWFFPVVGALVIGLFLKKSSMVEHGPMNPPQ